MVKTLILEIDVDSWSEKNDVYTAKKEIHTENEIKQNCIFVSFNDQNIEVSYYTTTNSIIIELSTSTKPEKNIRGAVSYEY